MLSRRRILTLAPVAAAVHLARARRARAFPRGPEDMPFQPLVPEPDPEPEPPPPPPPRALLTGELLPDDEPWRNELLPIAVALDNFPFGARPQMGMDRADLVYELLVEGGITRFLAVFHRQEAEWIEPVRSARTPMLYIARELAAVMGHVGSASVAGPADADSQFGWWGVHHFDGDISKEPFWRDKRRYAPHNAVTSTYELRGHAFGLGWSGPGDASPWLYREEGAEESEPHSSATSLGYGFALVFPAQGTMNASWTYDGGTNLYFRRMAGVPHVDGLSGSQLTARNVVVQIVRAWVGSRQGHVLYDLVGAGHAYVFRDGRVFETVWTKGSREERTRYWHPSGAELRFNPGTAWVALVPAGSPYWWR